MYLRLNREDVDQVFNNGSQLFLHDIVADLHLFKGATRP
jgi:hypothetical protein